MDALSSERGPVFALPPSIGRGPAKELALALADTLWRVGFAAVVPTPSYPALEAALRTGEVHAAWAPPLVCARVEQAGGRVVLRSIRYGSSTYRSVLLCRSADRLDHATIVSGGVPVRAAWVDRWSMAGYLLPRALLERHGVTAGALREENWLGSYQACFAAVLNEDADLCASYGHRRGLGYQSTLGSLADELRVISYSDECPNDAIALAPNLSPALASHIAKALDELFAHRASRDLVKRCLELDGFDRPPLNSYRSLLERWAVDAARA